MPRQTGSVPNQPRTPMRAVRVPDELWLKAQAVAKERGETVSDVIRDALTTYVKRFGK